MSDDIRSLVKNNAALYRDVEIAQEAARKKGRKSENIEDVMTLDPEVMRAREERKKKKK